MFKTSRNRTTVWFFALCALPYKSQSKMTKKQYPISHCLYVYVLFFIITVIYYIKDMNQVIYVILDSTQQIIKFALIYITNFIVQKGVPFRIHKKHTKIPSIKVQNEIKDMS